MPTFNCKAPVIVPPLLASNPKFVCATSPITVKSSLALSLGLVGALSIVRFRAAIKEPEELIYLFLTIAAGLGTGAGQIKITIFGVIFGYFLMSEIITWRVLISLVIIILGIYIVKRNNKGIKK